MRPGKVFSLLAAFCAVQLGAAQIADIKFEQTGADKLSERQLLYNMKLRPGAEYSARILDDDIKRLYATGNFADITAKTENASDGKVNLTFKIRLQPRIAKLVIDGNAKLDTKDIENTISLAEDSILNNAKLRESLDAVRKLYKDKGYNDATVATELKTLPDNEVELTIRITENLRLRVNDVTFEGTKVFSDYKLKESIANRYSLLGAIPWLGKYLNTGLLDRYELELDRSRIRDMYWNKGYLDFKIDKVETAAEADDPELMNIRFFITEGEPYMVDKVTVSGNKAAETAVLEKLINLTPEKPFDASQESAAAKAISDYYESMGYTDVNVRAVRNARFADHKVSVDFVVEEGIRYSVREVIISGNVYTKDKVIRRELVLQPGDPVDRNRIDASRSRLMGMGYFNNVTAEPVNADAVDQKDIHIKVEEKDDRFQAKIGAGFSDVNSLVGMAEISSSNFDITDPGNWFYGGGQRMRVQGLFGIERMGFNVDFTEPWLFDRRLRLDVSLYGNESEFEYWDERRLGTRVSLTRQIFDDFTSITGAYKFENVNVDDMDSSLARETLRSDKHENVSQFSLMLDRDTRDSLLMPTSGYNINLLGAISPKIMGSSNNFYRLELKGSYYYSFWDKAIIAMAGFRGGVVSAFNRDHRAPLYERYFLGGGDSLRGFAYRDVAPLDASGRPTGGDSMLLGTVEVSHPIWKFIRGAAFVDAGNAWRYSYNFQLRDLNVGVGYGLRIQMPVINAPIKLDLAYPVVRNDDELSSKLRFHFNMGFTW